MGKKVEGDGELFSDFAFVRDALWGTEENKSIVCLRLLVSFAPPSEV